MRLVDQRRHLGGHSPHSRWHSLTMIMTRSSMPGSAARSSSVEMGRARMGRFGRAPWRTASTGCRAPARQEVVPVDALSIHLVPVRMQRPIRLATDGVRLPGVTVGPGAGGFRYSARAGSPFGGWQAKARLVIVSHTRHRRTPWFCRAPSVGADRRLWSTAHRQSSASPSRLSTCSTQPGAGTLTPRGSATRFEPLGWAGLDCSKQRRPPASNRVAYCPQWSGATDAWCSWPDRGGAPGAPFPRHQAAARGGLVLLH